MSQLSTDEKVAGCLPYLSESGWITEPVDDETRQFVTRLVEALGDRLKLFSDILRYDEYFVADEELAERKARWRAPPPRYARGYGALAAQHITQADQGCDFDFLATRASVPDPEIH